MKFSPLSNQRVLVTGAAGFIGSHLVERLLDEGCSVRAFVHYNSRNDWGWIEDIEPSRRSRIEIHLGDLRDFFSVRRAVSDCGRVFHLGALIAIPYSYLAPKEYVETNVTGTLNVMQACVDAKVEQVLHTSTSEVYGTARFVPITEEHPLQGQSPYSASKIGADKIAESYHLSFGLPVTTIRPFNTFGPRQSARAVIPTIITQALKEKEIRLGSLHPVRDLTFVTDTVDGFIQAARSPGSIGHTVNLGTGDGVTVGNLAMSILKIMNIEKPIVASEERIRPENSEVLRLISGNEKARSLIGWKPRTSLEEGLRKTVEWFQSHSAGYKTDIYNV